MKFYQLTPNERRKFLAKLGIAIDQIDLATLTKLNNLSENVIGQLRLPLSAITDVNVNQQNYIVPLATEEPSVVAAANHGIKIFNENGGVNAHSERNGIYGQIILEVEQAFKLDDFKKQIPSLITKANQKFASLVKHGGGVKSIFAYEKDHLLYLRVLVDPAAAMGANKVNSILEYLSNLLEKDVWIKEKLFAILSNYPSQLTTAQVELDFSTVGGYEIAQRISLLSKIANDDVYRAVTNNKGIMNGVDAVLMATGNDYRAIEAASAVLASADGKYRSLSNWKISQGKLRGQLTLPLAIGVVGGSINVRKDVQQAYRILGKEISVTQLAELIVTVGLANNLAAMLAISTKGIQAGHMKLQARNLVANLQANTAEKEQVLTSLIKEKEFTQEKAQAILQKIREEKRCK